MGNLANVLVPATWGCLIAWYVVAKRRQRARGDRGRLQAGPGTQFACELIGLLVALSQVVRAVFFWHEEGWHRGRVVLAAFSAVALVIMMVVLYRRRVRPRRRMTGVQPT